MYSVQIWASPLKPLIRASTETYHVECIVLIPMLTHKHEIGQHKVRDNLNVITWADHYSWPVASIQALVT